MKIIDWPNEVFEIRPPETDSEVFRYNNGLWTPDDGEWDLAFACPDKYRAWYFSTPYDLNAQWKFLTTHWGVRVASHPRGGKCACGQPLTQLSTGHTVCANKEWPHAWSGDVGLHNDGLVLALALRGAQAQIAELKAELAQYQTSKFNPDWSILETTQENLRETWALIRELEKQLHNAMTGEGCPHGCVRPSQCVDCIKERG